MSKTDPGRFFEDFTLGQVIRHATPRTVTAADAALYTGLYGSRFAVQSSDAFARAVGYPQSPLDDWLVFHVVFGKTVPDISLNAVANLGYADGRFLKPVYPGATLAAVSEVIGLKESSNRRTGVVYVRSTGFDEAGEAVLTYCRWVLVNKRDPAAPAAAEPGAGSSEGGRAGRARRRLPADRRGGLRRGAGGQPAIAGATMRPASASTMRTG